MSSLPALQTDLMSLAGAMPTEALLHVEANHGRLLPGHYVKGDQRCLMALLTERSQTPIVSKETLALFFTGLPLEQALHHPAYQGPKWLVRWFDGDIVERYGGVRMTWDERKALVVECIRAEIARRHQTVATPTDVLGATTADAQPASVVTAV